MKANRLVVKCRSRKLLGLWLAALCTGLVLSLLFVRERVSADEAWLPQWTVAEWPGSQASTSVIARPSIWPKQSPVRKGEIASAEYCLAMTGGAASSADWDIRQEPIVEVEVDVRDDRDVALLHSMGYSCPVGLCKLELRDGQERALMELGLAVRPTARALKMSATAQTSAPGAAALGEHSVYGADWDDHDISDGPLEGGCGFWCLPGLDTAGAPADASITRVVYTVRIEHGKVSDVYAELNHWHDADVKYLTIWDRAGGEVDDGKDDDEANDYDIELISRETTAFNGRLANASWQLAVRDCAWWNTGHVDYWYLYVYYWTCDPPATPTTPYPTNGQTNLPRDLELNWADAAGATSYELRFGASSPPPVYAQTVASSYTLPELLCGTTYYWQVVAKHECGSSTSGPIWYFRTIGAPGAPTVPTPADGATDQPTSIDLRWVPVAEATSYDVYFGSGLRRPLPFLGNTTYGWSVGGLGCGVHYYWRIDSRNECGVTTGSEWDFTTACCKPGTPSGPSPAIGATGMPLGVDLDWADASGATSYDVYFDTLPIFKGGPIATTSSSTYDPGPLNCGTHYYWQIVAKNPCEETAGSVWDFATASCPTPTNTPVHTPTNTPVDTPTNTPVHTATDTPIHTPTATRTGTPADSFTLQRWVTRQGDVVEGMLWFPGDFDGDGKRDLATVWNDAGKTTLDVYRSTGAAFAKERWATRQGDVIAGMIWFIGDFDGDGKDDLAVTWNNGGMISVDVYLSTGTAFTKQRWATQQGAVMDGTVWLVGDFNGDGKDDLADKWNSNGKITIDVHASTGSAFTLQRWGTQQGDVIEGMIWFAGDFNGDGKDDPAVTWIDAGMISVDVYLSTATAFSKQRWATQQGAVMDGIVWLVGDFDGDGRDDLADKWNHDGKITIDVHASTGSAFTLQRWATQQGDVIEGMLWFVGDFNGDGKDDLAVRWDSAGMNSIDVYASTGAGFTKQRWVTRQGQVTADMLWFPGDFSGDGRDDLAVRWNDAGKITIDVFVAQATSAATPTPSPVNTATRTPTATAITMPTPTATLLATPTGSSLWRIHLPILLRRQ